MKKNKNPLKKLFVEKLGKPFYLNVVKFSNQENVWYPMFYEKWAGSEYRREAVKLRREAAKYLHENGSEDWRNGKNIKTVRINLFNF